MKWHPRPWTNDMKWELAFVVVFVVATITMILLGTVGCVGVDPSASMGDATITPALTAESIETAVQTAINSNASIVNDLWPIVAMLLIAVAGLVAVKKLNKDQTREIREHTENCTHS